MDTYFDKPAILTPAMVESSRADVARHIRMHSSLDGLAIEKSAPPEELQFSIIHKTPPLPKSRRHDRSTWYRCSFCETDRKFSDGYIVLAEDSRLRLIGLNCYKKHGVSEKQWEQITKDFSHYEIKEHFYNNRDKLIESLITLNKDIMYSTQDHCSILSNTINFVTAFQTKMPDLYRELKRNKSLPYLKVKQRPFDQEPTVELHKLNGGKCIDGSLINFSAMEELRNEVCVILKKIRSHEWNVLPDHEFAQRVQQIKKQLSKIIDGFRQLENYKSAIDAFFEFDNLHGIARWASDERGNLKGHRYRAWSHGLEVTFADGRKAVLEVVLTGQLFQIIDKIQRLLQP